MKKVLFAIALLLSTTAMAQRQIVRIDTIMRPYFEFDYDAWMSDPYHPLSIDARPVSVMLYIPSWGFPTGLTEKPFNGDFVQYNYIEGGVDISGISVWARAMGPASSTEDSLLFPMEYLYLYEATPDTFQQLAMLDFINTNPYLTETWPDMNNPDMNCYEPMVDGSSSPSRQPLHHWNFYFDKPIFVMDSFYVGASQAGYFYYQDMLNHPDNYMDLPTRQETWYGKMWTHGLESGSVYYDPINYYGINCWTPIRKMKLRMRKPNPLTITGYDRMAGLVNNEWVNFDTRDFWMVVPIINVYDTVWDDLPVCAAVQSFNIMSHFGDTVVLRWSTDGVHDEWQVSYGPEGTAPDDGTIETCHTNRWRYIDTLHDGRSMVAYVRTVCRESDTLRFSPWSWGLTWIGTTRDIVLPSNRGWLTGSVRLMPNPASDQVQVLSDHRMLGIEVYQADGRRYATLKAEGYTAGLSVQDWPKGIYVLRVLTIAGPVMQKLSVE